MKLRKIDIFDTTLRDGEQSPGASLDIREKIEIARQLSYLGVDIIEAGFPVTSPGDAEAVRQIALNVKKSTICALASVFDGNPVCEELSIPTKPSRSLPSLSWPWRCRWPGAWPLFATP